MLNLLRRFAGRVPSREEGVSQAASVAELDGRGSADRGLAGLDPDAPGPGEPWDAEAGAREAAAPPEPPQDAVPCPYCADPLSPPPPRTRRCPTCRQHVIVRRRDGRPVYLTESAAAVLEAQRHRAADEKAWGAARQQWLALARSVRAPEELVREVAEMPLTERAVEGARAVYRTGADQAAREARQGEHWVQVGRLRSTQATALYEDLGRPVPPPADILAIYREGKAAVLHSLAAHSPVAELAGSSCCKACRVDDGELATISVELRRPRLPHPECPRGLCDCDWALAVAPPGRSGKRRRPASAAAAAVPKAKAAAKARA